MLEIVCECIDHLNWRVRGRLHRGSAECQDGSPGAVGWSERMTVILSPFVELHGVGYNAIDLRLGRDESGPDQILDNRAFVIDDGVDVILDAGFFGSGYRAAGCAD